MAAKKNVPAPAVVQMLIGVIFPEQIINDMTQPVGISLHVNVRIHTAIVANPAITAVVPVVLNVRQVIHPALALHLLYPRQVPWCLVQQMVQSGLLQLHLMQNICLYLC